VEFGGASVLGLEGPVQIEVRDSIPVVVKQVQPREHFNPESFVAVNTIDRLFGFVRTTLEVRHDRVEMEFDSHWGFPIRAMMAENIPEGDTDVSVTDFKSLP